VSPPCRKTSSGLTRRCFFMRFAV